MTGDRIGRQLSLATRRELIQAIAERYHAAARAEKKQILDEFIKVTGYHRKHAIRALKRTSGTVPRSRRHHALYDEAVRSALTILWEAADRICGKRLKQAIPTLVDAMERYGHLQLDAEVRRRAARHERRHDGSALEAGSGGRQAKTAEIGDQHSPEKEHCRADVQRLE